MRILVVEDEMDMNRLLVKTLKREGYSVDGCFDGEEAWLHLMGAEYDAVVLDVMMPKKDGYTLIQELRDKGKDIPVLFLTAKDSIADRVKGLDLGADDYLIKPFEFSILEYLLRNKGNVVSREQIEDRIWNYEYSSNSNNVDVYMSKLRKKIDDGYDTKLIHTIRGVGWVLREEEQGGKS